MSIQQDGADRVVGIGAVEGVGQFVAESQVERIALFRTVQRNRADAARFLRSTCFSINFNLHAENSRACRSCFGYRSATRRYRRRPAASVQQQN